MSLSRKLAWFPEHFHRAALLLSRFVQAAQTQSGRIHYTSYLEELFWPWLSGTWADTHQRLAVVEELLSAPDHPSQESGMIALRGMLKAGHFSSSHDFSFGSRAFDYGWEPKTLADYQDWYGGALQVATRLALSESPLRAAARQAIAENFRVLWCFGHVFDELEEAAIAVGTQEHWPEGWLEVRETIGLDRARMDASLLVRLQALKEWLAPVGLLERLRSYVLTPVDRIAMLADWEADDADDGFERAYETVVDEARHIGREVGPAPALLDGILPELFGRDAHQAAYFGEGFADASQNLSQAWRYLLGHYGSRDEKSRNASLLGGFLRVAVLRDRAKFERFLDDAVIDPLLCQALPWLQFSAGVDEGGIGRLIASVGAGLAPAQSYWCLAVGRTTECIPAADLSHIVLGIASLPNGYGVAAEILHMHFHRPKDDSVYRDPSLLDCGRQLLRNYPVDQEKPAIGYRLAKIARVCLQGTEAIPDALLLCNRVGDAVAAGFGSWGQRGDLIETLLTLHPQAALDCWLGDAEDRRPVSMRYLARNDERNPFGKISTPILVEWAGRDPETRLPRLADVIRVLEKPEGDPAWSEAALALLTAATDRAVILQRLAERLRPSAWGGSLAVILEQRRPLIQPFLTDADPAVRQAARAIDQALQREIAAEAASAVSRDERFE
ncbi:MAG TPA: hypothetical protein VES73_18170 [Lamprocystis sp. (in: g-proteobacteria)]|nr:hypothetical protein [Lamprocystis sp. (in: g-proteobacteria)]